MVIVWRITEYCNLFCKFCGYSRELERPRREADAQAIRAFGAVLAEYHRSTGDEVLVSWLGGEPLLWAPLEELTKLFRKVFLLKVSTTTNGTCLGSAKMRAHLIEHYSELTISVDAAGHLHDELRGWPGGYAYLQRNVSALAREKTIAGGGPVLRANVLLMRQTLPGFEQLCAELARWGIEEITFNQLGGNDRPEFYPAHRLLPDQCDWLAAELPRLRARLSRHGVRLCGSDGYLTRIQASAYGRRLPVRDCAPGKKFLFIDESGLISPCSFTGLPYGIPMQEVNSLLHFQSLPARFASLRHERRAAVCGDCHSTQVFEKFAR